MTLLTAFKRFPEIVAQHIIIQVAIAIGHLHLHGVVHRDIKPDNVMITARGHAKLADFGLVIAYRGEKVAQVHCISSTAFCPSNSTLSLSIFPGK